MLPKQHVVAAGAHEVHGAPGAERERGDAREAGARLADVAAFAPGLDLAQDPRQAPDHGDDDREADDRAHDARAAAAAGRVRGAGGAAEVQGVFSPPAFSAGVNADAGLANAP